MTNKKNQITKANKAKLLAKIKQGKAEIKAKTTKKDKLIKAAKKIEEAKLLFSLDATASRQEAWNIAKEITGEMFAEIPENLKIALAYHSAGKLQQITSFSNKDLIFKKELNSITCKAGGTALLEILDEAIKIKSLKAIIYIGDCFEENQEYAEFLAKQLRIRQTRIFVFHDKSSESEYSHKKANETFDKITELTGGAVFPFDENSPDILAELLKAITILASQGIKALQGNPSPQAQRLLQAVRE